MKKRPTLWVVLGPVNSITSAPFGASLADQDWMGVLRPNHSANSSILQPPNTPTATAVASGTPSVTLVSSVTATTAGIATVTPTMSPTASGTPSVTLTPTFTPMPTSTAEPQPQRDVSLSMTASQEEAQPGDVLTYFIHLRNTNRVPLTHLSIEDVLPSGLIYVPHSAGGGQYDPRTKRFTWSLASLDAGADITFGFQARVQPAAPNPILNTAEVAGPDFRGRPTATASVHVRHATEQVVRPDTPARLTAPGGRVALDIPAGAVAQRARFEYRSLAARRLASGWTGLALEFELTARPASGGPKAPPLTRFEKPLQLTVDLTGLVDGNALGPYKTWFVGYRDETTGQWVSLPVVDFQPGPVLTVEVDHFTPFGAGATGVEDWGWAPTFNDAQVALFNGAFTYNHPLEVPPGRGGLQPDLNLSYSSRRVDGVISWIQPDWVGLGWSVDSVEIVRQGVWRCPGNPTWVCYKDEFTLVLNGAAYDLKPAPDATPFGRYHTADESFLYIERLEAKSINWYALTQENPEIAYRYAERVLRQMLQTHNPGPNVFSKVVIEANAQLPTWFVQLFEQEGIIVEVFR